jgi:hypothetical protein
VEDVRRQLSEVFPGVRFTLVEREPDAEARVRFSPLLRLWLALFGLRIRYPHYVCIYESETGFAIEFYFEAKMPIRRIRATLYGQTSGADRLFRQLSSSTTWQVKYPPF